MDVVEFDCGELEVFDKFGVLAEEGVVEEVGDVVGGDEGN